MKFQSTKLIDGFSACFRQEKSHPSHCSLLHGYALAFKIVFEGELDYRNWVVDFGFMKRSKNKIQGKTVDEWFKFMFDHTVLVSSHDTELEWFRKANEQEILSLRVLEAGVGCERFAQFVFQILQAFIESETNGRVTVVSVECIENQKNSAIYAIR